MGSTIGLLTQDGRLSARYHYDEFGMVLDQKKFDVNWPGPDNLYGYTGLEYDYYTDLNYARARYYKPEIGRFISEDTYKGTLWNTQSQNLYTYVYNNPLKWIDPSGFTPESVEVYNVNLKINRMNSLYHNAMKHGDKDIANNILKDAILYYNQHRDLGGIIKPGSNSQNVYTAIADDGIQFNYRVDWQNNVYYMVPSGAEVEEKLESVFSKSSYYQGKATKGLLLPLVKFQKITGVGLLTSGVIEAFDTVEVPKVGTKELIYYISIDNKRYNAIVRTYQGESIYDRAWKGYF